MKRLSLLLASVMLVADGELAQMNYPTHAGNELEGLDIPGFTQKEVDRGPERFSPDCTKGWNSRFSLKHREHRGVGYDDGYTTGAAFLTPHWDKMFFPFLDLRAHVFNDGTFASNAGIGFRMPVTTNEWVIGGNFYYDYRDVTVMGSQQISAGFEGLSNFVDVRLNGYLPMGGRKHLTKKKFVKCQGNSAIVQRRATLALPKVEAEVGFPVPGVLDVVDFYAAAGPYYLFNVVAGGIASRSSFGGRARVSARVYDGISLELSGTYDNIFHGTVQGMVSFSYPFGPANLRRKGKRWEERYPSARCDRQAELIRLMTQDVERSEIIPVRKKTKNVPDFEHFIFCSNLFGSSGTWEDPYGSLEEAFAHARPGDTIIFLSGDKTTHKNEHVSIQMKYGQRLYGSGEDIDMGDYIIPAIEPGVKPKMSAEGTRFGLGLGDQSIVKGVDIDGGRYAFYPLPGASSYTVENNTISNVDCGLINLSDIGRETEEGFTPIHPPVSGRRIIRNNTFTNVGSAAHMMNQPGGTNIIEGNVIHSARAFGFRVSGVDGQTHIVRNKVYLPKHVGVVVEGGQFAAKNSLHILGNEVIGRMLIESHVGESSIIVKNNSAKEFRFIKGNDREGKSTVWLGQNQSVKKIEIDPDHFNLK